MEKEQNPFPVSNYRGLRYFCDREEELSALKRNIRNGLNTTLFSIRRLGKTGLIMRLFETYANSRSVTCIYLDIMGTTNMKEFTGQLATAIYKHFPEDKGIGKKIINFIRSLRPVISYDELSGQPEVSFEAGITKNPERTMQQLLSFLDAQKVRVIFAIDEFQQILEYPEKNTEAVLRTCIQQLKNTLFIFCGSNQKMMHHIFNNAKRPFFASCSNIQLGYIERIKYETFIASLFKQYKKNIDPESVSFICEWTLGHTFYTQFLCNYLFSMNIKRIQIAHAQQAAAGILALNESTFYLYRNLLTEAQWQLLTAIARETRVFKPHSKEFILRYSLGTSSMITRGLDALLEKEMIFYAASSDTPYYEVYDKFLMRWLQRT